MLLSVIIPARNEKYLQETIDNVLKNIEGDTEIIVVLDGYWPYKPIPDHPRVVIIHHTEARGQRQSINEAAKIARGKFIMKLDAHCAVDKGFDVKLAADCEYDWTVVPRMYNLDVATWTPKLHKRTDYMFIGWNEKNELRSLYYSGKEWKRQHSKSALLDETMGLMGPCFFMHKDRFWELGGCDEEHGSWGQQGIEVACKAWLSGGKLMVNKKTWFAHWFRAGDGGFPYPISGKDVDKARKYSKELWLNDKWDKQTQPFDWLIKKFNPPTWENFMKTKSDLNPVFYQHVHTEKRYMTWRGVPILKLPTDLQIYHQVIWQTQPEFIIDIGTKFGGSALFYQDMLDLLGQGGRVITIDKYPQGVSKDYRIIYLEGGSTSDEILKQVKEIVGDHSVMVVSDGDHRRQQVKRELVIYSDIVTSGCYLVLEDCYDKHGNLSGPGEARDWFLKRSKKLKQANLDDQFLNVGFCRGGWLLKQ